MLGDAVIRLFNNESSHKLIIWQFHYKGTADRWYDFNWVRSLKEYPRLRPCRKTGVGHVPNLGLNRSRLGNQDTQWCNRE